jgi:hypothetical protein
VFATGSARDPLLELVVEPPFDVIPVNASIDPYLVEAVPLGQDDLLGFGPGSAPIRAQVDADCSVSGFQVLGNARAQLELIRVVFAGDTAWASELDGSLWRLPQVCRP